MNESRTEEVWLEISQSTILPAWPSVCFHVTSFALPSAFFVLFQNGSLNHVKTIASTVTA